ncbi:MAG: prephenate dehydrogenase dimerization domain-containing protein [Caldilineaceae bacterium]
MVHAVSAVGQEDATVWQLAAGGFRDTSRVAASDARMFMDILMTNRAAVLEQLDAFGAQVAELRQLLADADESALRQADKSQAAAAAWTPRTPTPNPNHHQPTTSHQPATNNQHDLISAHDPSQPETRSHRLWHWPARLFHPIAGRDAAGSRASAGHRRHIVFDLWG